MVYMLLTAKYGLWREKLKQQTNGQENFGRREREREREGGVWSIEYN